MLAAGRALVAFARLGRLAAAAAAEDVGTSPAAFHEYSSSTHTCPSCRHASPPFAAALIERIVACRERWHEGRRIVGL